MTDSALQVECAVVRRYYLEGLQRGDISALSWLLQLWFGLDSDQFHKGELKAMRHYMGNQLIAAFFTQTKLSAVGGIEAAKRALEKIYRFSISDDRFQPIALALTNQLLYVEDQSLKREIEVWLAHFNSRQTD